MAVKLIRWISYTSQNIPGNQSFSLHFHNNLTDALDVYKTYCREVGYDDCSMTLYATPYWDADKLEEMIESAKKFMDVGCPFDYPDRIIERGPLGGVKISNT